MHQENAGRTDANIEGFTAQRDKRNIPGNTLFSVTTSVPPTPLAMPRKIILGEEVHADICMSQPGNRSNSVVNTPIDPLGTRPTFMKRALPKMFESLQLFDCTVSSFILKYCFFQGWLRAGTRVHSLACCSDYRLLWGGGGGSGEQLCGSWTMRMCLFDTKMFFISQTENISSHTSWCVMLHRKLNMFEPDLIW